MAIHSARRVVGARWLLARRWRTCPRRATARPGPAVQDSAARDSRRPRSSDTSSTAPALGLNGAEITMLKSDRLRAITGDSGEFRIAGLPPGTVVFNVRRIGYEAASFTAVLKPGKTHRDQLPISQRARRRCRRSPSRIRSRTRTGSISSNARKFERTRHLHHARGHRQARRAHRHRHASRGARRACRHAEPQRRDNPRDDDRAATTRACPPTMYRARICRTAERWTTSPPTTSKRVELYVGVSEIPPEYDQQRPRASAA